jgi:uncharacterized protein
VTESDTISTNQVLKRFSTVGRDYSSNTFVKARVLKINVGFLLAEGPGFSRTTSVDIPQRIRLDDELTLETLQGDLRLTRTSEGILVQGELHCAIATNCTRCLTDIDASYPLEIEELFTPLNSGNSQFEIGDDNNIDLAPLIREESVVSVPYHLLCRDDCQGLCPTCGQNRNESACTCELDDIDPRWAGLADLPEALSGDE